MNFRYPIFLDLTGKKCVVLGDHPEIAQKLQALADAGARVEWKHDGFDLNDLSGCFLVITSLPDNSEIFRFCEQRNILCNAVDDPEHCRFSFGSVHRQGDLAIAISTNGWAPALAVRLREQLEREIGPEYGELLAILKEVRHEIASRVEDFTARRNFWYRIVDSDVLEKLRANQRDSAMQAIRKMIEEAVNNTSRSDTSAEDAGR
jgi:precorrin-2 dehydrogenase/sirohydrochlorin ferrochelatase